MEYLEYIIARKLIKCTDEYSGELPYEEEPGAGPATADSTIITADSTIITVDTL